MSETREPRILPGQINIGKRTSNQEPTNSIYIRIYDASSGIEAVEAILTPEDFAMALFGMGQTKCQCEWGNVELVGKRREHKDEVVEIPGGYGRDDKRQAAVRAAIAAYEVDGWEGHDEDAFNGHRRAGGKNAYRVTFIRYVDAE